MTNASESPTSSESDRSDAVATRKVVAPRWRKTSWLIPLGLLVLFVISAFATRLVKKSTIPYSPAASADIETQPVQGGVFRFPLVTTVRTLDPARARFSLDVMLTQQLYDGLTAFDKHLNIVPALAKFWEISPDGRTYTFELREDARFHNGRQVTAEDCVFSFERLLTAGLNDHNYHYFSRIDGAEAFHRGDVDVVAGLTALDDRTFQIRFKTPFVPALSVLSMYSSKILPKKEILEQGPDFFLQPIGTGAFQFARWIEPEEDAGVPQVDGIWQGLRFEANDAYFGGRPYLDAIVFRAVYNAREFRGAAQPLHQVADCLQTNEVETYADWIPVEANQLLAISYLYFPNRVPPYNDPRVRRAINLALDKRSFLDAQSVTAGIPAATGIVPPGIPGFIPKGSGSGQNLERAKALLAEAGYPAGEGLPPLELPILRGAELRGSGAADSCLVSCLSHIGIEVRLVQVERFDELSRYVEQKRAVLSQDTWYADFPDPDNFLRPLFHSEGPINRFGYANAEVDRLLDQVWSETSYMARAKLYHQIEEIILSDAPIIPTDYGRLRFLLRPTVRGFALTPLGAPYIKLKDIWLAEEEGLGAEVEL